MDAPPTIANIIFPTRISTYNFLRLCRLIVGVCSEICRILFSKHIPPDDLITTLKTKRTKLRKELNPTEKELIYPPELDGEVNPLLAANKLDILLMFKILKKLDLIKPHENGWNNPPKEGDTSIAACLEIIKEHRNEAFAHKTEDTVDPVKFERIWNKLKFAIVEMEKKLIGGTLFQNAVEHLSNWNVDQLEGNEHEKKSENISNKRNDIQSCCFFKLQI